MDSLRNLNGNVLLVDAGDFSDPAEPTGKARSQFVFRMLDRLGYDAIGFGEREFRLGPEALIGSGVPSPSVIVSNVERRTVEGTSPLGKPYAIKDAGTVRVGIFGLVSPAIPTKVKSVSADLVFRDPFEATRPILETFARENVDLVVLLSSLEPELSDSLLAAFNTIDVAVLGHPNARAAQRKDLRGYDAVPVIPDSRGQSVSKITLTVDPSGVVVNDEVVRIDIDARIKPDPQVATLITDLEVELKKLDELARAARTATIEDRKLADRYLGGDVCARCHEPEAKAWQATGHAHAFETLTNLGMEASEDCFACHTVGRGKPSGFVSRAARPDLTGVQCEACHGYGTGHHSGVTTANAEALCRTCHDQANSPEFEYQAYLAKIRHW